MTRSYVGVLALQARPGKSGQLQLTTTYSTIQAPAQTGAAGDRIEARATAAATGTLTTANSGAVTLTGTYDTGTSTFNVNGGGYQVGAAVAGTTLDGSGTHASTYNGGLPFQTRGQFQFVATPKTGSSTDYDVTGQGYNDVDATRPVFTGSLRYTSTSAGTLTLTITNSPGAAASGSYNGTAWSGTYSGGIPAGSELGNWQATRCL